MKTIKITYLAFQYKRLILPILFRFLDSIALMITITQNKYYTVLYCFPAACHVTIIEWSPAVKARPQDIHRLSDGNWTC